MSILRGFFVKHNCQVLTTSCPELFIVDCNSRLQKRGIASLLAYLRAVAMLLVQREGVQRKLLLLWFALQAISVLALQMERPNYVQFYGKSFFCQICCWSNWGKQYLLKQLLFAKQEYFNIIYMLKPSTDLCNGSWQNWAAKVSGLDKCKSAARLLSFPSVHCIELHCSVLHPPAAILCI